MTKLAIGVGLALLMTLAACPARADKCTGAKLKAVGKKEARLLACQAKVAAKNDTSGLMACESKVAGKFSAAFAKAGSCVGDEMGCEDIADTCDSAVAAFLTDTFPSKCEAAKRKAAGKLSSKELGCYAKAAAKGLPLDTSCITKAQTKFGAAFTKAGACPDGGSPQTLVEHNCVMPVVTVDGGMMVTDVCPTTTTSTSTSTSTTTESTTSSTSTTTLPTCTNIQPSLEPGTSLQFPGPLLLDASGTTSSCNSLTDLRFFWLCISNDTADCNAFHSAVNADGNTHPQGTLDLMGGNTYIVNITVCSAYPPPPAICAPPLQATYTAIQLR